MKVLLIIPAYNEAQNIEKTIKDVKENSEYDSTTEKGWTTANVTDSSDMFKSCTKLVGGNGTVYDSTHIDATYARIDKAENPGYLTKKE